MKVISGVAVTTILTDDGLDLLLIDCPGKGVRGIVRDEGIETHHFLIEKDGPYVVLRDMKSNRTLTLEVTK